MARLTIASLALCALTAAACSSKNSTSPPDATPPIDAPPPIDAMPDALVCTAPNMMCTTGLCTNTDTDPMNCGQCGMTCTQGGSDCFTGTCGCPAGNFMPDSLTSDAILAQEFTHILFDLTLMNGTNGQDAFIPIVATMGKTTGDFTLTAPSGSIPTPPVIAVGYNVDIANMSADAYYVAVSGTLNISSFSCVGTGTNVGSEIKGTLTDVMFQGATFSGTSFTVDPSGCTFTVPTFTFDVTSSTACTP